MIKVCVVDGCDRKYHSLGYCEMHYSRVRVHGEPGVPGSLHKNSKRSIKYCNVDKCNNVHKSLGYCGMHYTRFKRYGEPGSFELQRHSRPVRECQVNGCIKKHDALGYCRTHYMSIYRYGITPEEIDDKIRQQKNLCKLCQKPLDLSRSKAVHIDHCHISDIVRGILCAPCNVALGYFQDSIPLLERTIEYIRNYGDI